MVGIGPGQPDVVGADVGRDVAVAVLVADDVGFAVQFGIERGEDAVGRQAGQGGERELGVGVTLFADAAAAVADHVQIEGRGGKEDCAAAPRSATSLAAGRLEATRWKATNPLVAFHPSAERKARSARK
jgi:hypothetical protein